MKRIVFVLIIVSMFFSSCIRSKNFYVSLDGNDSASGTKSNPFKTIHKALECIYSELDSSRNDFHLYIREGVYFLDSTLTFSSTQFHHYKGEICIQAYENEKVVISGGKKVTNWEPEMDGIWKASLNLIDFRQLYVNNRKVTRARGGLPVESIYGDFKHDTIAGYKLRSSYMSKWKNMADIEIIYQMMWSYMIGKIDTIICKGDSSYLLMKQPYFYYLNTKPGRGPDYIDRIENALELVDQPNEWYFNKHKKILYYYPSSSEYLPECSVIAPNIQTLVSIKGTILNPVKNIVFKNIEFKHSNWLKPSEVGHLDVQANFTVNTKNCKSLEFIKSNAAIELEWAEKIGFVNCIFSALGSAGININNGSKENCISYCRFFDISGSAIQIGNIREIDHHPTDNRFIVKSNRIENCEIVNVAWEYESGVGIFIGYTDQTIIEHNEIHHLPYTGISIGWGWGSIDLPCVVKECLNNYKTRAISQNNLILYNHIHHTMMKRRDGGDIYTLGRQPGTLIKGNYIHDSYKSNGIYIDEGSADIRIQENVIIPYKNNEWIDFNNKDAKGILKKSILIKNNYYSEKHWEDKIARDIIKKAGIRKK